MKKVISFILVLWMCLSLCACGEKVMTKEEMLQVAEYASVLQINNDTIHNVASAKQTYCGKVLKIEGPIDYIEEDHIAMAYTGDVVIDVYLPVETITTLKNGQYITIVGKTENEISSSSESYGFYTWDIKHYTVNNAYLIKDTYTLTGTFQGRNTKVSGEAYNLAVNNSATWSLIYFDKSVDLSKYSRGDEITVVAKKIGEDGIGGTHFEYVDAVILEN